MKNSEQDEIKDINSMPYTIAFGIMTLALLILTMSGKLKPLIAIIAVLILYFLFVGIIVFLRIKKKENQETVMSIVAIASIGLTVFCGVKDYGILLLIFFGVFILSAVWFALHNSASNPTKEDLEE